MRIPNIYIDQPLSTSASTTIEGQAATHLLKALRMKHGDELRLFNGDGNFYCGKINNTSKKSLDVDISDVIPSASESSLHTHIGQVISRGDRMDYAIQKSTEMGVNEITPLFSERCEVKLNAERSEKRQIHWQQVAISAAEQCGRASIPKIHPPTKLEDWISSCKGLSLVLHHRDTQNLSSLEQPNSINLLIGPEGGLSDDEIEQAKSQNFIATTLGPRVLRTETAPITALSIVQWLWGDL
jgi:16S rRNA (uracil1498-N3)-methyltransferase